MLLSNLLIGFLFVDIEVVYFFIDNLYSMIVFKDGGLVNNIMGIYKEMFVEKLYIIY